MLFPTMTTAGSTAVLLFMLVRTTLSKPILKVQEDGTFKLALFCDMHYGEGSDKDVKSSNFQQTLLSLEKPNFVVIDGDASSNYASPLACKLPHQQEACKEWFLQNWEHFTSVLQATNTPYAYTLGNHDRIPGKDLKPVPGNETDYSVPDHWIMEQDIRNQKSLTQDGPVSIHGASNYVVPIMDATGKEIVAYVWLMDSSDNNCMGTTGWGCVYPDQVEWYRNTSKRLIAKDGRVIPGLMFHHIPLDEVNTAWNDPSVSVWGSKGEQVCCFSQNTGLFDAIKDVGNIWGVFHGHDHNNDFVASYHGVYIGFGRKSGYGGYGGSVADQRGSRIFELKQGTDGEMTFETWIRQETGEKVVQEPALNRASAQKECCGTGNLEDVIANISATDAMKCRVHDDVDACRRAASVDVDDSGSILYA
mmetsp:Transcript_54360/g.116077  ORF Transcript_54360/g.116077 Transcript_54360/m.116077 type:complete len:419 (+) Transcript_54360:92-1348(+)